MTDSAYMVMVKLIGNLALFASVKRGEAVDVHLLNLAKMDKVEQWLEKEKPAAVDDVLRRARTGDRQELHQDRQEQLGNG